MTKITPRTAFLRAMEDRIANRPFETISAYKVRESRDNIARMLSTLTDIIAVVSSGKSYPVSILLGGCTTEDKAIWLKDLPGNLARELGENLIPAVQALNVEGVPEAAIDAFVQSIKGKVCQLLKDCDTMQTENWKKINPDIFGSMIQAVADDEERGALGMHYTSVPNILAVSGRSARATGGSGRQWPQAAQPAQSHCQDPGVRPRLRLR